MRLSQSARQEKFFSMAKLKVKELYKVTYVQNVVESYCMVNKPEKDNL